jgi:hypothetical protein
MDKCLPHSLEFKALKTKNGYTDEEMIWEEREAAPRGEEEMHCLKFMHSWN